MKRAILLIFLIVCLSSFGFAGNVHGTITENGKPLPQGVKVEVACGSNNTAATTDAYGAYKMFVADKGKCTLKLSYGGQSPSLEITSFDGAIEYNLLVEKQGDKYTLKRQ